jgi:hypothetical protein
MGAYPRQGVSTIVCGLRDGHREQIAAILDEDREMAFHSREYDVRRASVIGYDQAKVSMARA